MRAFWNIICESEFSRIWGFCKKIENFDVFLFRLLAAKRNGKILLKLKNQKKTKKNKKQTTSKQKIGQTRFFWKICFPRFLMFLNLSCFAEFQKKITSRF